MWHCVPPECPGDDSNARGSLDFVALRALLSRCWAFSGAGVAACGDCERLIDSVQPPDGSFQLLSIVRMTQLQPNIRLTSCLAGEFAARQAVLQPGSKPEAAAAQDSQLPLCVHVASTTTRCLHSRRRLCRGCIGGGGPRQRWQRPAGAPLGHPAPKFHAVLQPGGQAAAAAGVGGNLPQAGEHNSLQFNFFYLLRTESLRLSF